MIENFSLDFQQERRRRDGRGHGTIYFAKTVFWNYLKETQPLRETVHPKSMSSLRCTYSGGGDYHYFKGGEALNVGSDGIKCYVHKFRFRNNNKSLCLVKRQHRNQTSIAKCYFLINQTSNIYALKLIIYKYVNFFKY